MKTGHPKTENNGKFVVRLDDCLVINVCPIILFNLEATVPLGASSF